ncbi:MAG: dihydrodipicolinate synthase family protein [Gaiellaceae bacterium]
MWRGVYPAICTPFTADGEVDLDAQRRVVRFALDCGSHGIVAFGLAGEVLKLSADERRTLTDVIVDEVAGSVPVFVGAGAPSIRASVELARHAEQAGASCIVLPAPLGGSVGKDALVDYFVRVAASVSIPVMIQDAPAYLGVGLGPELVRRIGAAAENVRLVKLEAGPVEIGNWIVSLGDEFAVWGGDGGIYLLDCVRSGAVGIIPGGDLVDRLVEVYEADARGDSSLAEERFREILPVLVFEMQHSIDHYNTCAKHVLVRRGVLENPGLRPPATTFGAVSHSLLDRHLASLQIAAGARVD